MTTSLAARVGADIADVCSRIGYTHAGIASSLGPAAFAAMGRGEPAAVRRVLGHTALHEAIRLFILHDPLPLKRCENLLGSALIDALLELSWAEEDDDNLRVIIDIRPLDRGGRAGWVISDMDASMVQHIPGKEHVLGVGAASLSLAEAVPHSPVDTLLDLGCGSGVQLILQADCAERLSGSDISERALSFAHASLAASHVDAELLHGPWFEPVHERRFDRIVANPPFVVGPASIDHVYRDSGKDLDGATELVVREACAHLSEDGSAHLVGAWALDGGNWAQRVSAWIPSTGYAAWVLERDRVDAPRYVSTWLKDESIDPRSDIGQRRTEQWLDHFDRHGITGVGFGFIHIQRLEEDTPSEVVCEDFSSASTSGLGDEVEEYFLRTAWLRQQSSSSMLASCYQLRPGVCIDRISRTDDEAGIGMRRDSVHIARTDGPRFSHEIDEAVAALVAGLHPQGLPLGEIVELYAAAEGMDSSAILPQVITVMVDMIRHGLVLPAELIAD
ncbi:N5-glutamine S-adenosyl-L-methionine-dependent methyltransferase [Corynebacterium ciconiae DSM 44920]|uniref:DUF7782 domain-containing protein n=1 Tax=Corynebacterium ciconiae TaxID=227319 RepID=UPI00035FEC77|nr:methyltransferase [Corynebacterium ciconiae]WKD61375.1 N5-glutamine S-adenosyl-L-methionine-dependent methyltransferase [Corynebacterium ciconiae DSM 44920]